MKPPGVKDRWDDNGPHTQALILAYSQIKKMDTEEWEASLAGAKIGNAETRESAPRTSRPKKKASRKS